ncbi:FG-GAP repeat domain-containing protein [Pseudoxanthomonas sp. LjRoot143]|uniref:FG-GAP repeat domain-containing protein n=1 Tax=Pseudoxanthomonas sp. LjRoot143 TaxID=3342266 RepID=UPI003F506BB6
MKALMKHSIVVLALALCLSGCGQRQTEPSKHSAPLAPSRPQQTPSSALRTVEFGLPTAKTSSTYSLNLFRRYAPPPSWLLGGAVMNPEFYSVEIGDFTGDGRDDIATIVGGASSEHHHLLYVLPQLATGDLGPAIDYPLSSYEGGVYYNYPFAMVRADLNHDGTDDLVLTRGRSISLLTADGAGGFRSLTYSADRNFPLAAVVLDVNRDGHQDVVAYTTLAYGEQGAPRNGFVVHYGDGRGGISGHSEFRTSGTVQHDSEIGYSLATGDLNSDGYPDLVARISEFDYNAQIWRHVVSIHLHDKKEGFLPAVKVNAVLATGQEFLSLEKVAVADLTRDGLEDLVATAESVQRYEVRVFPQNLDGSIETTARVNAIYPIPTALDAGDLDGDGYTDLLIAHSNWNNIGYLLQGQAGLQDQVLRGVFAGAPGVGKNSQAIGDLNGDGCADAVVVGQWEAMAVLHGTGCTTRVRQTGGNALPRLAATGGG